MKSVYGLVVFVFLVIGCASPGGTKVAGDGVFIDIAPHVLNHDAKMDELTDRHVVETMHRYIVHRFKKLHVRPSLNFYITITGIRLRTSGWSPGADFINVDVTVKENGSVLKEFKTNITTVRDRGHSVKRMSKGLAKRIYDQIRYL